jgi:hypothetical protein
LTPWLKALHQPGRKRLMRKQLSLCFLRTFLMLGLGGRTTVGWRTVFHRFTASMADNAVPSTTPIPSPIMSPLSSPSTRSLGELAPRVVGAGLRSGGRCHPQGGHGGGGGGRGGACGTLELSHGGGEDDVGGRVGGGGDVSGAACELIAPGVGGVNSNSTPPSGMRERLVPRAMGPRKLYASDAITTPKLKPADAGRPKRVSICREVACMSPGCCCSSLSQQPGLAQLSGTA